MPALIAEGRLFDMLAAHRRAIIVALTANAAAIPSGANVFVGEPSDAELVEIGKGDAKPIVAISADPNLSRNAAKVKPFVIRQPKPNVPLTVTQTGRTILFGGAIITGLVVSVILGNSVVTVTTTDADVAGTIDAFAHRVVAALNAAAVPFAVVGALLNGFVVGGVGVHVNVSGTTNGKKEVDRIDQRVDVNVWAKNGAQRGVISDVIRANIGTKEKRTQTLAIGDGTHTWTRGQGSPIWTHETIQDASLDRATLYYMVEYGVIRTTTLTQVGSFSLTTTTRGGASVTVGG